MDLYNSTAPERAAVDRPSLPLARFSGAWAASGGHHVEQELTFRFGFGA